MKAQFKNTDYSGTELTLGKKYDVIDVECKKKHEVARILIQNDEGHEKWYEADDFIFHAEATMHMEAALDAAMSATMPVLKEQPTIIITTGNALDAQKMLKSQFEEMIEKEIWKKGGLMYGA